MSDLRPLTVALVFGNFFEFLEGFGVKGGFDVVVFCDVLCDELDPDQWGSACGESNDTAELFVYALL